MLGFTPLQRPVETAVLAFVVFPLLLLLDLLGKVARGRELQWPGLFGGSGQLPTATGAAYFPFIELQRVFQIGAAPIPTGQLRLAQASQLGMVGLDRLLLLVEGSLGTDRRGRALGNGLVQKSLGLGR